MADHDPATPESAGKPGGPPSRLGQLLVRDFLPGWRPHLARWQRPSRVLGLAVLASLLCGLFLHAQGLVLALSLLVALVLGLIWPNLGIRGLVGEIWFEANRVREGEPLVAQTTLRNWAPWGAWALTVELGTGRGATIALVGPWRTVRHRLDLVAGQRGVVGAGSAQVASGFPFGFRRAARTLQVARDLIIWPRTVAVGPIPLSGGAVDLVGPATSAWAGGSGDFVGVRPYRRGDSVRRVHWAQTARLDALMVVERQADTRPGALVILDGDWAVHAGSGVDSSREWAIRVVASLIGALLDRGVRVEAVLNGDSLGLAAAPDPRRRADDALARLGDHSPPLAEILRTVAGRRSVGTRIIVTTDRAVRALASEPSGADLWVIMRASGFDPTASPRPADSADLPVRPWVVLEGPGDLAALLGPSRRPVHAA